MITTFDCNDPESRSVGIEAAAGSMRAGRPVVFAADTSYAIGSDAFSEEGCNRLRQVKGMPSGAPLAIMVGSWNTIDGISSRVSQTGRDLIEAFWPGGLSLIIYHAPSLAWGVGNSLGTVVVRMPIHPVALELLRNVGPLAASVAPSHDRDPLALDSVKERLGNEEVVCLDSGLLSRAERSTIVDLTGDLPVIRRVGSVSVEAVEGVIGNCVVAAK